MRVIPGWRRAVVTAIFLAAIVAAGIFGRAPSAATVDPAGAGFTMAETGSARGIDFVHKPPLLDEKIAHIAPHVGGIGASVSVADFDLDGAPDLYFTQSRFGEPNALYRNLGDGRFEEVAGKLGAAELNRREIGVSMGSIWGDVDGDGREDLFVYAWGRPTLLLNRPDGFADVTEAAGLARRGNTNAAVFLDYDRDGRLDLYLCGYFREETDLFDLDTTRIMQESFEFADNGGRNILYRNLGDGRFADVTDEAGVQSTRWTLAAASADLDGNGWPDLYLANDYGVEELFLNREGRFVKSADAGLEDASKSGMCVAMGDVLSRGVLDVYVTNITSSAWLHQGNNLRINRLADRGRFFEEARGVVQDAGWAWGAQFGDLDNDGRPDLAVMNGFISASRDRDYWYAMSKIAGATSEMFEDAATWPPIGDLSLSGYERSRLLLNRGDRRFEDVAPSVGVTDLYDGRGVAFADVDLDGDLDMIVANQSGPALVYENRLAAPRRAVRLQLVGRPPNTSAIGAEVVLHAGGRKERQVVAGGMGFASQGERILHFGVGGADAADRVEIRWPDGTTQTLTGLAAGRDHRIEEPAR